MPKLAALFSPERADDVVDPATRRLLEDRFEVVWAETRHATGPARPGKPPALDPAAVPELATGADVLLTSWVLRTSARNCGPMAPARRWSRTQPARSRT